MLSIPVKLCHIQKVIKTYDQSIYPVEIDGSSILVNV